MPFPLAGYCYRLVWTYLVTSNFFLHHTWLDYISRYGWTCCDSLLWLRAQHWFILTHTFWLIYAWLLMTHTCLDMTRSNSHLWLPLVVCKDVCLESLLFSLDLSLQYRLESCLLDSVWLSWTLYSFPLLSLLSLKSSSELYHLLWLSQTRRLP